MTDHDHSPTDSPLPDTEIRLLRTIVEEVRDAPPPPVDWDVVEARLLARVTADSASRRRQAKAAPRWSAVAGFAAAAAAVVFLAAGIGGDTTDPDPGPVAADVVDHTELVAVPRGAGEPVLYTVVGMPRHSAVQSGAEPMRFTLPGVVTWTLAPNSRVVMESVPVPQGASTMPHVVRLEHGRIDAEVVPRRDSDQLLEAFVVDAGATRVAVHGTVFSVERRDDVVDVEVTRGSVTVGPAHHRGVTTGHLMVSPQRATFRAGRVVRGEGPETEGPVAMGDVEPRGEEQGMSPRRPGALAEGSTTEPTEVAASPRAPATAPTQADVAEEEQQDEVEEETAALSVAAAQGRVLGCLATAAPDDAAAGTKVTVSSQVTAVLSAEGEVLSVQFAPPLRPDLQQRCAGVLLG
ncbi:MAG: FecR domain-containing protein, partial [Polyangiaceae bacterium]